METTHAAWAAAQFADAPLGDVRRARRAVHLAQALLRQPGASLPRLAATPYALKASYNLFAQPAVTPARLQAAHRAQVHAQLHTPAPDGGPVLLLEDTTVLSWAGHAPIPGLGPIGPSRDAADGLQGFLLHSVLAVRWAQAPEGLTTTRPALTILGLADQVAHVRQPVPAAERTGRGRGAGVQRPVRWRESDLWRDATTRLGPAPGTAPGAHSGAHSGVRWVRVCDREADMYEFLLECTAAGHGFVVRAAQDRRLRTADARLWATLEALPAQQDVSLRLRGRDGAAGRIVRLAVAACPVALAAPHRPRGGTAPGPLACTAVRVWERAAPAGTAALEWRLLTDAPLATPAAVVTCVQQYATRWAIEEFHKGLKTGLGAERLQLGHGDRLRAAVALLSVVALRLLALKEWAHAAPNAPATVSGLSPLAVRLLAQQTRRPVTTVREVALALGRLGGHLNRRGDGLPGWLTLWRGIERLDAMMVGAELTRDAGFG